MKSISFDASNVFATTLLEPLLGFQRSTSDLVRADAMMVWKELGAQCKTEEKVVIVAKEVIKLLTGGSINNYLRALQLPLIFHSIIRQGVIMGTSQHLISVYWSFVSVEASWRSRSCN